MSEAPEKPRARMTAATVERIPTYLRVLEQRGVSSRATISSEELSGATGVSSETVRRDLWLAGVQGLRGVGWQVDELRETLWARLTSGRRWTVAVAGFGNIGMALGGYWENLATDGFDLVAAFDSDPDRVGVSVGRLLVDDVVRLQEVCQRLGVSLGVVATPARSAQSVVDAFVEAGVTAILNFAPVHVSVPDSVVVRRVDLLRELHVLSYLATERGRPSE